MKRKSKLALIFIISFFTFTLSGCIEKKEGIKFENRDYLVYNIEKIPKDLSMLDNNNIREKDLLFAIFEGLVKEDSKGNILPAIADDWTISKDGLSYKFKIREDAKWSNGNKITAEDFREFFQWILKEGKNNEYIKELKCIYGVSEYMNGRREFEDVAINAKESNVLEIRLNNQCNYFLNILSHPLLTLREKNVFTDNYLGNYHRVKFTGPFTINNIKDEKEILLNKNKHYWEDEKVLSNRIDFIAVENQTDALIKFEKDNPSIDLLVDPPKNEINRLWEKEYIELYPSFKTLNLVFNLKNSEVSGNINFRQSIKHSLSREIVSDIIDNKNTILTGSIIPSATSNERGGDLGERDYSLFKPNITVARDYLKKSNLNTKQQVITLIYKKDNTNKILSENIKNELEQALDIKVNLEEYEENELNKNLEDGKFHMALLEFSGTFDNPICFLNEWKIGSNSFYTGYENINFDHYVNKAKNEQNHMRKIEYIRKGEELLLKDMPLIPFLNLKTAICKKNYVKGVEANKNGNLYFNYAYIDREGS